MKRCNVCKTWLTPKHFFRSSATKDGLQNECKVCFRKRDTQRRNDSWFKILHMLHGSKNRAKNSGQDHNISVDDIVYAWPEDNLCPALKLELKFCEKGFGASSPTVDRLDSRLGYVKGNIAVISGRANRLKSDATLDEVKGVLDYMTSREV